MCISLLTSLALRKTNKQPNKKHKTPKTPITIEKGSLLPKKSQIFTLEKAAACVNSYHKSKPYPFLICSHLIAKQTLRRETDDHCKPPPLQLEAAALCHSVWVRCTLCCWQLDSDILWMGRESDPRVPSGCFCPASYTLSWAATWNFGRVENLVVNISVSS